VTLTYELDLDRFTTKTSRSKAVLFWRYVHDTHTDTRTHQTDCSTRPV